MTPDGTAQDLHTPVLLDACLELLGPALKGASPTMIDATLGMGGHAEAFLQQFPRLHLVGIDRDPEALALASARLEPFGSRFIPFLGEYSQIRMVAEKYGHGGQVDAVLMDLGVSSLQLDDPDRGFSYSKDAPLDMRMDQSGGITARELLATASVPELTRIFRDYGEERFASRIANSIVKRRDNQPIETTTELASLVKDAIPAATRRTGGNPAKRSFQALRIAVNEELTILERALPKALQSLRVGGRLAVESYQSLEDRMVKNLFNAGARNTAPVDLPFVPEADKPKLRLLLRKAMQANMQEQLENPRSRPVRLRAVELISPWGER